MGAHITSMGTPVDVVSARQTDEGVSHGMRAVLHAGALDDNPLYERDTVLIKEGRQDGVAENEEYIAKIDAAIGWECVPALVDPALVFRDPPDNVVVMRWLADSDTMDAIHTGGDSFVRNRVFECVTGKGDTHPGNTLGVLTADGSYRFWSIDHDEVRDHTLLLSVDWEFRNIAEAALPYVQEVIDNGSVPEIVCDRAVKLHAALTAMIELRAAADRAALARKMTSKGSGGGMRVIDWDGPPRARGGICECTECCPPTLPEWARAAYAMVVWEAQRQGIGPQGTDSYEVLML